MYMQKNEIFLNFVSVLLCFGEIEWRDSENYGDYKSIIEIIVLGSGNDLR